jgi:predicted Zn-dependent protease
MSPAETLAPWVGADRALEALDGAVVRSRADHLDVFLASRVGHHTRFAGDRIHQPQTIVELQVMVRAVVGRGAARAAVSDLRHLPDAVDRATELARGRDAVANGGPASPAPAGPQELEGGLSLWSDATAAWDGPARSRLAARLMAAASAAGGECNGTLTTAATELAVATSAGAREHAAASEAGFSLTQRVGPLSSYLADLSRHSERLGVEARSEASLTRISGAGEPVPLPDGGLASGELVGFVPSFGFTAPAVQAGIGPLVTSPGVMLADGSVTVADDALTDVGLPFPFDLEGTAKQRVAMLDGGRAGAAVSDRATAGATHGRSTGHAHIAREQSPEPEAANLVMTAGADGEDALIAAVERGVYVQRLWYNRLVDAKTGTVLGTTRDACFLIKDGVLSTPVAGGRFTESVLGALARTDGIGDRLISQAVPNVWNGCVSAPAIRVRGFRFGARPAAEADE